jgi:hypothetical protein
MRVKAYHTSFLACYKGSPDIVKGDSVRDALFYLFHAQGNIASSIHCAMVKTAEYINGSSRIISSVPFRVKEKTIKAVLATL